MSMDVWFPDTGLSLKVQECLEVALRLAAERSIIRIHGRVDGVPFTVAIAAGGGGERLDRIIDESGPLDPRSTHADA